ncbi:DUF3558 family protein [Saccharothrix algeriensis]|uniref:DUF3558 family protein n=1 Tax=Saccharothrix algeriensis TaxID=173560 RepID=A0A8T8HTB9_9PSEU|nr:DUF3558 family protein [Saccharothrix algeriensis]MBM7813196.1 hypothetical protein [Saccharothrix algeriensis]QTR01775.1 DUF3558 family protein [Saccharothrix algeriensis]
MRRRAVLSVLVAALGLASGCAYSVNGTPVSAGVLDVEPPFSSGSPSTTGEPDPSTTGTPGADPAGDICGLLTWKDLPYDVRDRSAPPTDTGYDPKFDQSCKWQTSVDEFDVGVTLRFRAGRPITLEESNGEFDLGDRKVRYFDRTTDTSVQPSCVMVMDYAGGGIGIIVIDGSARFGAICEQGRKVAEVLLAKEPTG